MPISGTFLEKHYRCFDGEQVPMDATRERLAHAGFNGFAHKVPENRKLDSVRELGRLPI